MNITEKQVDLPGVSGLKGSTRQTIRIIVPSPATGIEHRLIRWRLREALTVAAEPRGSYWILYTLGGYQGDGWFTLHGRLAVRRSALTTAALHLHAVCCLAHFPRSGHYPFRCLWQLRSVHLAVGRPGNLRQVRLAPMPASGYLDDASTAPHRELLAGILRSQLNAEEAARRAPRQARLVRRARRTF